ncbi:CHAT domain-containing protein [Fusarium sp. MPI-SDFR-AT-0072]|nr:CHAT domain-containing protein [Fusarium sp. MPI-SDFR-AT-0072]
MKIQPVEPEPIREGVLSHLRKCKIFHFAGHGYTDTADPSKSQLYLKDWQTNPLTVASLLELNLHREGPFLAYLSACGTGQIKSQKLFDEGIHLISACQLAGFRHVIGTLWEVNDQSCVDMAAIIYEEILGGDMSDDSVCRGVHVATEAGRDQWLDETYAEKAINPAENGSRKEKREVNFERDIISLDEDDGQSIPGAGNGSLHWVPYVHFGA